MSERFGVTTVPVYLILITIIVLMRVVISRKAPRDESVDPRKTGDTRPGGDCGDCGDRCRPEELEP